MEENTTFAELPPMSETQQEIRNWFNDTYKKWGFMYLRPEPAYEIFASIIKPEKGHKHLDVACGLGLLLNTMTRHGAMTYGVDLSDEAIKKAKEYCSEADIRIANAEQLPYENESFDSISCIGSLERMLDREKVLKEQFRVLKSDGKVCLMVRNSEHFVWKYLWKPLGIQNKKGHQDAMNLQEWTDLFEKSGYKVEALYPDHWPYYKIRRFLPPWKIDPAKILKFPFSIQLAYEFIFVLRKS